MKLVINKHNPENTPPKAFNPSRTKYQKHPKYNAVRT